MTPAPTVAAQAGDPLPASSVTVPALPGWVISRPRLTERVAAGAAMPLTVLTGPPGAGKTTALASWAGSGQAPGPVAWVTLDHDDNKPATFWSHVLQALRHAGIAIPGAGPGDATGRAFLARMASDLGAQDPPVVLVLDDLHLITGQEPLQGLAYVLKYAWPGLRLMAAARMDPPLPLHRYRLAGELTEIRSGELSLTVPEAARLLAWHGITLPAGTLELVVGTVEGWAAGLRLAASSGHTDPELFVKNLTATGTAITGYLMAEALDTQPAAIRDLMLVTSIVDRFNADLACELTGDRRTAGTLTALARSSMFVQPLGHGWYRYHPLLAGVLRHQLQRISPGRLPGLHRSAARWHRRSGLPGEAVVHAAQISDWPLAATIAVDELAVGDLLDRGIGSPVTECLRRMPGAWGLPDGPARPQALLVAAALTLAEGRGQASADSLGAAERLLAQLPADQEVPSRLTAALIRLAAARRTGDLDAAGTAAASAQTLFDHLPDRLRTRHPGTRAQVLSAGGTIALWSGDLAAAAAAFSAAGAAAPDGSRQQAGSHAHLALIEALRGQLGRATELTRAEPSFSGPVPAPEPAAAVALALVHLERHEPAAWHARLQQADIALRAHPDRLIGALACLTAARGALARTRAAAAADLLQRARRGWSPPSWLDHLLTVAESQVSVVTGDIQAALGAANRAGAGTDASVALARAWLAAGNIQAARQALARAAGPSDTRTMIQASLTDALISYRSGDPGRGHRLLQDALRLGEPDGYRLPFVMDRAWIQPALRNPPDRVAAGRRRPEPGPASRADQTRSPVITRRLTNRELEVLRCATSMLTTEEIASTIDISVNTVKTHFKNIFCKLGATTRREALRRAAEQELI